MRSCRVQKKCRHCRKVRYERGRGLCYPCYSTKAIIAQYPPAQVIRRVIERNEIPKRLPLDPLHRCTWCLKWRCDRPMALCVDCQEWYNRNAAGMPDEKAMPSRSA